MQKCGPSPNVMISFGFRCRSKTLGSGYLVSSRLAEPNSGNTKEPFGILVPASVTSRAVLRNTICTGVSNRKDFFEQIGNQSRISFDGVIDVRPVMQEDQRIAKQIGRRLGAVDQEENAQRQYFLLS
jgi:hypothetical protein